MADKRKCMFCDAEYYKQCGYYYFQCPDEFYDSYDVSNPLVVQASVTSIGNKIICQSCLISLQIALEKLED
jgi:hypothetical protein